MLNLIWFVARNKCRYWVFSRAKFDASDRTLTRIKLERKEGVVRPMKYMGIAGTLWAVYNGVTEWVDHRISSLNGMAVTGESNRISNIWFGTGASIKSRAYRVAIESLAQRRN